MSRRLAIDWTACEGRGLCGDLLPELLEPDPWGYPRARRPEEAGPGVLTTVPDALDAPARRAVHLCPVLALRLEGGTAGTRRPGPRFD